MVRWTGVCCVLMCVVGLIVTDVGLGLPLDRHYEQVSPLFKGGYGVGRPIQGIYAVAGEGTEEGNAMVFLSQGIFAGAPNDDPFSAYLARRGVNGWSTSSVEIPATLAPDASPATEFETTFGSVLFGSSKPGQNLGEAQLLSGERVLFAHLLSLPDSAPNASKPDPLFPGIPNPAPNFEVAGVPLKRLDGKQLVSAAMIGASGNLCTAVMRTAVGTAQQEPLMREAIGLEADLYEIGGGNTGCGEGRFVRLSGVRNTLNGHGEPELISRACPVYLGGNDAQFNAVSADGSEVFFSASAANETAKCAAAPAVVYVRLNGERTVQVSKAVGATCEVGVSCPGQQSAEFVGASETGSKAFFTTAQDLVPGDADTSKDLYMAEIGCPALVPECGAAEREVTSMVLVSRDPQAGKEAGLQGIVDISPDGGRVYYVAHGVLSSEGPAGEAVQQAPVEGADNLYVYDSAHGSTHFIADLCSGPERSGEVTDRLCPKSVCSGEGDCNDVGLWLSKREAQSAGSGGRFFVFTAFGRLSSSDVDSARDVYRYDAGDGELTRVSVGEGEFDANGNNSAFNASLPRLLQNGQLVNDDESSYRAMNEYGSRIVFESAEPLSPSASNGLTNAYEWHEGEVSLVSSGSDPESVGEPVPGVYGTGEVVITPSGNDLFFVTAQGLLPQDTDGAKDVYDARLGKGFSEVPAHVEQCPGSACRGPLVSPAPVLVPASALQSPEEAASRPLMAGEPKPKGRRKPVKSGKRGKKKGGSHRGHAVHGLRSGGRGSRR